MVLFPLRCFGFLTAHARRYRCILAGIEIQTNFSYLLAYVAEDDSNDSISYCISNEDAVTVHPADATWICEHACRRTLLLHAALVYERVR